ncbi:hypothetical protein O3P69_015361 [Scylla paramamosain]|uniref:Uncharacterized protein n=1 Tax=Scylla paramamosain TaxID=85552 RepID=A0AAW0T478_SCYPA
MASQNRTGSSSVSLQHTTTVCSVAAPQGHLLHHHKANCAIDSQRQVSITTQAAMESLQYVEWETLPLRLKLDRNVWYTPLPPPPLTPGQAPHRTLGSLAALHSC